MNALHLLSLLSHLFALIFPCSSGLEQACGESYLFLELGLGDHSSGNSSSLRLITSSFLDVIYETLSDVRVSSNKLQAMQVYPNGTSVYIPSIVETHRPNILNYSSNIDYSDLFWTTLRLPTGNDGVPQNLLVNTRSVFERPSLIAAVPFFWELSGRIEPKEVHLLVREAVGTDEWSHIAQQVDAFILKFQPTISIEDFELVRRKIYLDAESQILRTRRIRGEVREAINKSHRVWGGVRLVVGDNVDRSVASADGTSPPLIYTSHSTLDITDRNKVAFMLSQVDVEVIIAEHVLEHLKLPEAMVALRLLCDTLVDGGALYIAVPDYNWMLRDSLGKDSLCFKDKVQLLNDQGWLQKDIDAGHQVQYDAKSLGAVLVAAGFDAIEVLEHWDERGSLVTNYEETWSCDEVPIRRSSKCGQSSSLSLIVRAIKSRNVKLHTGHFAHVLIDLTDSSLDESDPNTWEPIIPILIRKLRRSAYKNGNYSVKFSIIISDITVYSRELHRILSSTNGYTDVVSAMVLSDFVHESDRNITHIITSAMHLSHLKHLILSEFEDLSVVRINTIVRGDDEAATAPATHYTLYERNLYTISKTAVIPIQFGLGPEYSADVDIKSDEDTAMEVGEIRRRLADSVSDDGLRKHIMTSPYVVIPVARHQCRTSSMCAELEASIRSAVAAFREDERYRSAWETPPTKSFELIFVGDLDMEQRRERLGLGGVFCLYMTRSLSHTELSALMRGAYALLDIGASFASGDGNLPGNRNYRVYNSILAVSLGCPVISVVPRSVLLPILERISMNPGSIDSSFSTLVDALFYSVPQFNEGSLWRAFRRIRKYYEQHAVDDFDGHSALSRLLRSSIMGWNEFASVTINVLFH